MKDIHKALCIRKVSNWSKISKEHKFESSMFNPDKINNDIDILSPKIKHLLNHIKELDEKDMKENNTYYKHFIFSDVKQGGYGAKILTSALIANGKHLSYNKNLKLKSDEELLKTKNENILLLSSTPIFKEIITSKIKKEFFSKFNERPNNIFGELIRFIILDNGFKEGIDLFDVKYIHILEPQISSADQKQVIGRGTRTCGQKGLIFNPNYGWKLNVYIYDTDISYNMLDILETSTLFTEYIKLLGIDLRKFILSENLDKLLVEGSVDYELNKNIHDYNILNNKTGGAKLLNSKIIKCDGKCGKSRPTKDISLGIAYLIAAYFSLDKELPSKLKLYKSSRTFFCEYLQESPEFCSRLQEIKNNPSEFIKKYENIIVKAIKNKYHWKISTSSRILFLKLIRNNLQKQKHIEVLQKELELDEFKLNEIDNKIIKKDNIPIINKSIIFDRQLSYENMKTYINQNYSSYKWDKIKLENLCEDTRKETKNEEKLNNFKIVELSPTQKFISDYFTPNNPLKGMLLYHSVGSGKTCCAINTATKSFEKENYTILWVTRSSLKSDIWKNMFDMICSETIIDKIKNNKINIPVKLEDKIKLLSQSWSIKPMSYKQFSNMISGNNSFYKDLVKKNGETDPLRKTLLIIDEAHKLYGGTDLLANEKPNMEKLKKAIQNSYNISGKDSVRILLMSATPYTNDPMEVIKLLNLLKEEKEYITDNFDDFYSEYINENNEFTIKSKIDFLNKISGYISYLNRSQDARQFAIPEIVKLNVPMSYSSLPTEKKVIENFETKLKEQEELIENLKIEEKDTKLLLTEKKKIIKKGCNIYTGEQKKYCEEQAKEHAKKIDEEIKSNKILIEKELQNIKTNIKSLRNIKNENIKLIREEPSQESVIRRDCFSSKK